MVAGPVFVTPLGADAPETLDSYRTDRCRWTGCREDGRWRGWCLKHFTMASRGERPPAPTNGRRPLPTYVKPTTKAHLTTQVTRRSTLTTLSKEPSVSNQKGITKEQFLQAVETSDTLTDVARALGCARITAKDRARRLGVTKFGDLGPVRIRYQKKTAVPTVPAPAVQPPATAPTPPEPVADPPVAQAPVPETAAPFRIRQAQMHLRLIDLLSSCSTNEPETAYSFVSGYVVGRLTPAAA